MIGLFNRSNETELDPLIGRKKELARAVTRYLDMCDPYAYCTDGEDHETEEEFLAGITADTMSHLAVGDYDYVITNVSEWSPERGYDPEMFDLYDGIMNELTDMKGIDGNKRRRGR